MLCNSLTLPLFPLQIYRDRERDRDRSVPNIHELTTRTVSMSRDQQIDHGFGICVKGGKDSGEFIDWAQRYAMKWQ